MSEQHNGGVTRRQALGLAAAAAAALEGGLPASPAAARGDGVPRERSFDEGWLFLRGDADGAQEPSYDDSAWRPLDLPHDWSIEDLPYATSADGAATSDPSLLVIKDPDPDRPGGPQVIGPFDPARSENGGSTGYTVGGIGWYRKHFAAPAGHAELRSWSYVDVGDVHYNANGKTYGPMHAAHPERAMTQSEGFPATIHQDTEFVAEHTWAVGNWVWAAWDYLGESGIGKTPMAPEGTAASIGDQSVLPGWSRARTLRHSWGGFGYPYPYVQGNCGDLDLIGQRKPQNHWRAALTGRSPVELLVERPVLPGTEQVAVWWGYFDELADWTWDVDPGHPMTVHVYTAGDSARILLDGEELRAAVPERAMATFTVPYRPGELTAVAHRDGGEIGRTTLRTAGAPAALRLVSDVRSLTTARDDLAHVLVEVTDRAGLPVPDGTLRVGFGIRGAGELVGVANGNPHNVDSFKQARRHTWHGRALAVMRPAERPGRLTLTATAPGLRPTSLTLPVHTANSQ